MLGAAVRGVSFVSPVGACFIFESIAVFSSRQALPRQSATIERLFERILMLCMSFLEIIRF